MIKIIAIALVVAIGGYWLMFNNNQVTPPADVSQSTVLESPSASIQASGLKVFAIEGGHYYFDPDVITVKKDDTVRITLNSVGGEHDLVIDEFNVVSEIVDDGESTTFEFTPDQVGEFEYYCSIGDHREGGMVGTLIVTE